MRAFGLRNYELRIKVARLCFIAFVFSSCVSGSRSGLHDVVEAETPKTVTNYLTEKYQDVAGTKLSLLPPDSFQLDAKTGGWVSKTQRSWIIASSLQTKPLLSAGMYKARLTDKTRPDALEGSLVGEWDIMLNARQSRMFKVETEFGGDDYLQYVLFTGDTTSAYRIVGNIHEDEIELAPKVKASLLSIFYDAERRAPEGATHSSSPCNCEKDKH